MLDMKSLNIKLQHRKLKFETKFIRMFLMVETFPEYSNTLNAYINVIET